MYLSHFRLKEFPFGITPDTSFFFSSRASQQALNTLLVATRAGEGFIKITGEVGTGKTMLCRRFMGALDGAYVCAYLPNPLLEPKGGRDATTRRRRTGAHPPSRSRLARH